MAKKLVGKRFLLIKSNFNSEWAHASRASLFATIAVKDTLIGLSFKGPPPLVMLTNSGI